MNSAGGPPNRSSRWPALAAIVVILGLMAYGIIGDADEAAALAVVCIGLSGLVLAATGKPSWPGVGITERLLHRLPDPLWRLVMGVMGVGILGLGIHGLVEA